MTSRLESLSHAIWLAMYREHGLDEEGEPEMRAEFMEMQEELQMWCDVAAEAALEWMDDA